VSRLLGGETFTIYPCRGEYAELTPAKRSIVNHLVCPVPDPSGHGLGVHLVKTLAGAVWLPTIKYQDRKDDYEDDRLPIEAFLAPASESCGIEIQDLRRRLGNRAKIHPPSESFADFSSREIGSAVVRSRDRLPGLTSSLAIGKWPRR
jgi:L-2-hydroxyglutarate oxidase LhgO